MNIYEGLESLSFCIMTEQVKKALRKDPRNAEAVLNIPYKLITYVCKAVHSNIYNDIQLSPQQKEDSLKFISNVLKEDESIIHAGIYAYATFINPLGKFIRENLNSELDDSSQIKQVIRLYRGFGLDIVLGVFDELIKRGVSPRTIAKHLFHYQRMTVPNDNFRRIVKDSVEAGIISGACDTKEARTGEMAGNIGGVIAGAKAGAVIGSIIMPGVGTVVGAAVGSSFGKLYGKAIGNAIGQEFKK